MSQPSIAKPLNITGTVERVASAIRADFQSRLADYAAHDSDVDLPREWFVHPFITWEAGWSAGVDLPAIFVHTSHRGLRIDENGAAHPGGPDLNVGFYIHCHRDRIAAAARLGAYVTESLWSIARDEGFAPHVHSFATYGKSESTDWAVTGTVLFGLIDGAPENPCAIS